jgi:hypothetical protein
MRLHPPLERRAAREYFGVIDEIVDYSPLRRVNRVSSKELGVAIMIMATVVEAPNPG